MPETSAQTPPDPRSLARRSSLAFHSTLAAALAAGAWVAWGLVQRTWVLGRSARWDEAGNVWGGVELWAALSDGRLLDFLVRLNEQDKWPFGFSLLLMPFLALGKASPESATLLPAIAFALVPALLVWAGRECDPTARGTAGVAAGLVAGALFLVSPLERLLATVVYRETAGAALAIAVLAAYLRARRERDLGYWRLLGVLLLVLFFTKYNYFLLSGTALLLHAGLEIDAVRRRELLRAGWRRIAEGGWRSGWGSGWRWAAIALGAALISLAVGINPGGLVYGSIVIASVRGLFLLWKSFRLFRASPRELLARLPAPARGVVETLVAPIWLWSLSPDPIHPRNVLAFLRNRSGAAGVGGGGEDGGGSIAESLSFYPRVFSEQFTPERWSALAIALAALAGLVWFSRRKGDPARALALAAGVGALGVLLHPYQEPRFAATVAPVLFLLATATAARGFLSAFGSRDRSSAAHILGSLLVLFSIYGVFRLSHASGALDRLEADHRLYTADPVFRAPLADIVARVIAPSPRRQRGTEEEELAAPRPAFLGGFDQLSENLVRWEAWRQSGSEARLVRPLRGLAGGDPPARVKRRLAAWLERQQPERIVVARPFERGEAAASGDYRRWNAWQLAAIEQLGGDRAWRPRDRERYRGAGVEVTTWVRVGERKRRRPAAEDGSR